MKIFKKMSAFTVAFGAAVALVISAPLAASADVAVDVDTDGFIEIAPGSTPAEFDEQVLAALQSLQGRQSSEEIEALRKLPHTYLYAAEDNGVAVSAVNTGRQRPSETMVPMIVGGQFCLVPNMCVIQTSGAEGGYMGTGILVVNIPNVREVRAGSYAGSVTSSLSLEYGMGAWGGWYFGVPIQAVVLKRA